MPLPKITLRDFTGGLNLAAVTSEIAPNEARRCLNLLVDKRGRLRYPGGQHPVIPHQAGPVRGFARYSSKTARRLVFAVVGAVFAYDEYGGFIEQIGTCDAGAAAVHFASIYDRVFWCDGTSPLREWTGEGQSRGVGIAPPASAPTAAATGTGLLQSSLSGTRPYTYYVTFKNTLTGIESAPGPASAGLVANNQQGSLSDIPVSPDSQVNARCIYRDGGTASVPRLVTTITDNTSTVYVDNTSDLTQSLTQAVFNRDLPPTGLSVITKHKNRLFGVKGYTVHFSNKGEPEYWPIAPRASYIRTDGGSFDVDAEEDNPIVSMNTTGSVLVLGRRRDIFILIGDDHQTFVLRKVAELGVASHRSMVRCVSKVLFLAGDGMVYALNDESPEPVGEDIEPALRAIDGVYLSGACAAFADQRYILCIPQGPGITPAVFCFDFRTHTWTDLSGDLMAASLLYADTAAGVGGELLMATADGYKGPDGANYNGIVSTLAEGDRTARPITYRTGDMDAGESRHEKVIKSVRIEGDVELADPAERLKVTLRTEKASFTFRCVRSSGVLLETTVPAALRGRLMSVEIEGTIRAGEINLIELEIAPV